MAQRNRRSSLLNIENWLDRCTNDEPDSMLYDPDYTKDVANTKTGQKLSELKQLYATVADICTKIGLPTDTVDERLNDIDDCITTFLKTIEKDVQDEFEKLCQYKQELLNEIQKMHSDLYLPPFIPDENITLLQHCKRLKTKFAELNVFKQKRMTRLQELRDKQQRLCLVLGIKPPKIKLQTDIPTEDELTKLASAVADLEVEEKKRIEKYNILREMISRCIEQLEYEPKNEFETSILQDKTDQTSYTESHLLKMSEFHTRLEAEYKKQQQKYDKLKSRLESLYDRLDVDLLERQKFFDAHNTCKPTHMLEMQCEIDRYEELKRQNIGKFIDKIKDELLLEYERCFMTQEEQDSLFSLKDVSEELLELFERELERVKNHYEENKSILEKFQKWREMWKELIDLEVKANDPNRFNNRGGQLLIEEKKRKALQKRLPKVEEELMDLNQQYSASKGSKFTVFNTPIDEFIAGCWDELNNAKEEEKRERQRAKMTAGSTTALARKGPQVNMAMKRTPTKRVASGRATPTPSKYQCQRSVLGTPANSSQKLNQLIATSSVKKSVQKPTLHQTSRLAPPKSHLSGNKSNIPIGVISNVNQRDKTTNSNGSDFSALSLSEQEFEEMIVTCPASAKRRAVARVNK